MSTNSHKQEKYKHRGRSVASYGRRVKDTAMRSQIVVTDDDDGIMYHSLPKKRSHDQTNLFIL